MPLIRPVFRKLIVVTGRATALESHSFDWANFFPIRHPWIPLTQAYDPMHPQNAKCTPLAIFLLIILRQRDFAGTLWPGPAC